MPNTPRLWAYRHRGHIPVLKKLTILWWLGKWDLFSWVLRRVLRCLLECLLTHYSVDIYIPPKHLLSREFMKNHGIKTYIDIVVISNFSLSLALFYSLVWSSHCKHHASFLHTFFISNNFISRNVFLLFCVNMFFHLWFHLLIISIYGVAAL